MTGGALLSMVFAGTAPVGGSLTLVAQAEVSTAQVSLGQVADLSVLPPPLRVTAARVVVASFRSGQHLKTLTSSEVAYRARMQVPALAFWFAEGMSTTITLRHTTATPAPPRATSEACVRVLASLERDEAPTAADFEPAPCGATVIAFRYDVASGVARVLRDLSAGDIVTAPPASVLSGARPGQTLFLRARVGPVVVERAVAVVRPSAQGRPLFVKTSDGRVFATSAPDPVS